jgi:REP element-mobilizing transposase RayT
MPIARKHLIDDAHPGAYHLISRYVRRAYLCGDATGHRRDWLAAGIERARRCFAVDVLSFAVMDNHLHLVVTTHPDRAQHWSDHEVATRWAALYPHRGPTGQEVAWSVQQIKTLAGDSVRCHELRRRLASISWMMKTRKERVARRANHEDRCTGHFWESRFRSVRLLDQAAVLACIP